MGYVIALAGKGGTGKTTTAALLIKILKEKKRGSILGIDADPNSNLAEVLGLPDSPTIGTILDTISRNPDSVPANMGKDHYIEYQVQSAVQEADGFDVLTMGRPEGPGCYCYVNNALRAVMQKLIKNYDYIVIDNEAGLEHLSRRTTRAADALVVVSDVTKVGLRAAQRINDLAHELDIKIRKRFLIVNQCVGECDARKFSLDGLECLGALPQDQEINARSINGDSLLMISDSSVSLRALRLIGETIWQR